MKTMTPFQYFLMASLLFISLTTTIAMLFSLSRLFNSLVLVTTGETTTGTLVNVESQISGSGKSTSYNFYRTVKFTAANNRQYEFKSKYTGSSNFFNAREGEEVAVIYLKSRPGKAEINNFWILWGNYLATIIGGTLLLSFFAYKLFTLGPGLDAKI